MTFPEKKPMIVLTSRTPKLEDPFKYYENQVITPNDEFFVRYHMACIPISINPNTYRLKDGENVEKPLEIPLESLKKNFPSQRIVVVNQCSGNSRGLFEPRLTDLVPTALSGSPTETNTASMMGMLWILSSGLVRNIKFRHSCKTRALI